MLPNQPQTTYDTWDDVDPIRLVHSRLYALEPRGVGTAQVESITSYLARLAVAHRVSARNLMMTEIAPLLRQPRTRTSLLDLNSCGLLRVNDLSKELVWILQRLTGRLELPYLTIQPWAQVMNHHEAVRTHRAWCSGCLEEQRSRGEEIYEYLWWSFQPIEICARHAQPLQTHCPHCGRPQSWLGTRGHVGYCSVCQTWLGIVPDPHQLELAAMTDRELAWQQWLVEAIGELLAAGPALRHVPLGERLATGLSHYCAQVAGGQINKFVEILKDHKFDIPASYMHEWLGGGRRQPTWLLLMQLCFCLQIKPLALLSDLPALNIPLPLRSLDFLSPPVPQSPPPALNRDQLEKQLNAVVAAGETPAPSLSAVARRLKQPGTSSLVRYFPEQCATIVERHQAYRQAKKEERLRLLHEKVRQATHDVHAQGLYPSITRVATQLEKRAIMRDPNAREFWKEALRELGLES